MPRIDPLQLLNCLNVLLTSNGGIRSEQEVARISSLMEKFSKKLVSKCVYLLILKSSDIHLLSKFMGLGGWNLIYNWLLHAVEAKNYPFLIELLEVIIICPVDIERLKSNPMPRQIKYLSKDFTVHSKVRDLASDIVKHWLAIVKGTPPLTPSLPIDSTSNNTENKLCENSENNIDEDLNTADEETNDVTDTRESFTCSVEEVEEDKNYEKSTSPSSCSLESDGSDDAFTPYKRSQTKKRNKIQKKEKLSEKNSFEETSMLKSKIISNIDVKESTKAPIKLKIKKKKVELAEHKMKKIEESSVIERRAKEKRKQRENKEKEKFSKLKQEREKKEKHVKEKRDGVLDSKNNKSCDEKLKSELSNLIPRSLEKLGRIPKIKDTDRSVSEEKRKEDSKIEKLKTDDKKIKKDEKGIPLKSRDSEKDKDINKKDKETGKSSTLTAPVKKPISMSVEKRFATGEAKPKTVKAYNSKFRLTGLEQEVTPKVPSRKLLTSGTIMNSLNNNGSNSQEKNAAKRSPTKDFENEPVEKRLKSPDVSVSEEKLSPVSSKVKKPFLQESDFFMNAMNTALENQKENLRKRKKPSAKTEGDSKSDESLSKKSSDALPSAAVKSNSENKDVKPAFKFYKDTLDVTNEGSNSDDADIKPVIKSEPLDRVISEENIKEELETKEDQTKIKSAIGLKSSLSIFRMKKYPKKTVKWKQDDELESVQYFEVDVSERTNVVRNFWDMQIMERTKERESMLMVRKIAENDKMAVQTKWRPLILVDVSPSSTTRGINSQEKNIQYARERAVPPAIYFNKSMVPDTPAEPDLEIHPVTVPPVIPLDDISGSQDSINDFSSFRWPEPKQYPPENGEMNIMNPSAFIPAANMPPPMFPSFPDGTFPPPFGQPFFPGGPVGPVPVPPANWTPPNDQNQQNQNPMPMNWPPNVVPPPGPPGMMGPPPPFGMMGPPFPPIPGPGFPNAPNMFPPGMNQQMPNSSPNSDSQSFSNTDSNKKWNNEDRFYRKDGWKNNYSDRGRDKRNSNNWRGGGGGGGTSRLCRIFSKKGFCNVNGCRFYHPEN